MEVVLQEGWPPTVRIPDVVVASTDLIEQNPSRLHAEDVLLAIEVVSPGPGQTDRVVKRHEYAKVGISAYRVVELGDPATVCRPGGGTKGSARPASKVPGGS